MQGEIAVKAENQVDFLRMLLFILSLFRSDPVDAVV